MDNKSILLSMNRIFLEKGLKVKLLNLFVSRHTFLPF